MTWRGLGWAWMLLCACDHSQNASTVDANASEVTSIAPASSASPAASTTAGAASAAASASAAGATAWSGTYKSAVGTLYVPPDWKKVHWSNADTSAGVGDGTMALSIDGSSHRVEGTLDGPLGPAVVTGVTRDDKVTATVRRKDPSDQGFIGTLQGTTAAGHLDGTMSLSLGLAGAVRSVTFSLTPTTH